MHARNSWSETPILKIIKLLFKKVCFSLKWGSCIFFWFLVSASLYFSTTFAFVLRVNWRKQIYLQGMWGWSESERIVYQMPYSMVVLLRFVWFMQKVILVWYTCKLLKISCLQEMKRWSEAGGISYQTPIRKIKNLLSIWKSKNKNI